MKINDYIKPNLWKPVDGLKLEDAALHAVKSKENTLVIAGPGAGKTELLAQRACFLLQTNTCCNPKRILAVSFKKDAARNLFERVEKRCGKELAQRFESMTYDAFAKELIDRFNRAIPQAYRPHRDYDIANINDIRCAFELAGFKPEPGQRNNIINDRLNNALIRNKLPIVEKDSLANNILRNTWQLLLNGNSSLDFKAVISFQMISRLAEYLIRENPLIKKSMQMTYSYVFLDEFQDTTDIQYDLIKTCFLNAEVVITAVGDSKQRIMLWARAMESIFVDYKSDFNAKELKLVMNHRSAPRLVELQKLLYSSLNESDLTIQTSPKWKPEDGSAYLHIFKDHIQETDVISTEIQNLVNLGVKLSDICILVKQLPDTYAGDLIIKLNSLGLKSRNECIYQDFLKEESIKIYINIFYLAYANRNADAWVYIMDTLSLIRDFDSETEIDKIYLLQKELERFLTEFKKQISSVNSKDELRTAICGIVNFFGVDAIKSTFPQYKRGSYFDDLIEDMAQYLWKEYEEVNEWLKAVENLEGLNSIPVMTIHKSKGLEYDTVFFIGLEDAAFWNFRNQPDEDRCAFFVALSRAKRRVDFTFSRIRPTRFNERQSNLGIKEFYELLRNSNIVQEIDYSSR
ncbi:ATP-dependent helicase [Candidatus Parcubacteria bacterium]|nr:MAG: ATP-dependent helicase [Candidatus Parcubacteria bacterium]